MPHTVAKVNMLIDTVVDPVGVTGSHPLMGHCVYESFALLPLKLCVKFEWSHIKHCKKYLRKCEITNLFNHKKVTLFTAHSHLGNVMVGNVTFLWFLLFSMCYSLHVAVNLCINCSFVHLSPWEQKRSHLDFCRFWVFVAFLLVLLILIRSF